MPNPLTLVHQRLQGAIEGALGSEFAGADPVLRPSSQPGVDYQANAAMALAKRVGKPPREVAEAIVAALEVDDLCSTVSIGGPGFLNLTLSSEALSAAAQELVTDDRLAVDPTAGADRVVIDYSHPNVAKEMHVGHLRSTIIGDCLARVLGFLGHDVVRHNHIGDWGTPFGMLIEHLLDVGEEEAASELSVGDLTAFYQAARVKFDSEPGFADRSRQRVVMLQAGDEQTLRFWHVLVAESARYFNTVYDRLGVLLTDDDLVGESFYNPWLDEVAEELESRGIARIDDGALCAFPPGFTNREGEPLPLIVRKSDGGYGYQATDLAAIRHRVRDIGARRLVYVVDAGQSQHLEMVFAIGREAGWVEDAVAEQAAFGLVLGPDKKRLKTRAGDNVKLIDLLDEAVERAAAVVAEKNPDLDPETRAAVAHAIGIGAVKYADLANDRVKDYVFDWERMLAFEGNTGPYLQYAHARIHSIFRRGEMSIDDVSRAAGTVTVVEDAERSLVLHLLAFGDAVRATAETLQPHRLCTYLFELASLFTAFYEHCPVLRAEDEGVRASRLALCAITARALGIGLELLGISAPQQM